MLGYPVGDLRSRDMRELCTRPRRRRVFENLPRWSPRARTCIRRYLHRDGHLVLAECVATIVRDERGPPIMTVAVVIDVTQREELQGSCATRLGTIR